MHASRSHAKPRPQPRGFSLLELMIAVAVIGILLAVAFPSYQNSVRKGRRAEAINAINAVQQAQERSRANFPSYCDNNHLSTAATSTQCGLNVPNPTTNGYYTLAVSDNNGTGYIVTATATGSQADDTLCIKLAARVAGGSLSYGSGSSTVDWTDANRCWAK